MVNKLLIKTYLAAGLLIPSTYLYAQSSRADTLFREGERLRTEYEFARAREAYIRAQSMTSDSVFSARAEQRRVLCDNGLILSNYVVTPHVLGRKVVPSRDFALFYDLTPSGSWAHTPDTLLSLVNHDGPVSQPLFFRPSQERLVFAARDSHSDTGWDIYMVQKKDTVAGNGVFWGPPIRLGPQINTPGNEVYPVLSADGNTLYFSSDGLPGMGGLNLFSSRWNKDIPDWETAENMGIPLSSTSNDMLYMLSDDSRYFYFVSDRAAPKDSVVLYKVEFESSPVKIRPGSVEELRQIASLSLPAGPTGNNGRQTANGPDPEPPYAVLEETRQATAHYAELVNTVRNLAEQVRSHETKLDSLRKLYGTLSREEDRLAIANTIREEEFVLMDLQQSLRHTRTSAQTIEDMFLSTGVLPPVAAASPPVRANETRTGTEAPFHPARQAYMYLDGHFFEPPVPVVPPVNLAFRIEEESVIVPWENEPMGLYYRIQLFTVTRKASLNQLKGISPVFEVRVANRYVYYAGQFYNYAEASAALAAVRRQGITGALVVAYYQGKSVSVQEGRRREARNQTAPEGITAFQVYLGSNDIPSGLVSLVNELTDKDIIRVITDTGADYFIGPFSTMAQAQALVSALQEKGYPNVSVRSVTN